MGADPATAVTMRHTEGMRTGWGRGAVVATAILLLGAGCNTARRAPGGETEVGGSATTLSMPVGEAKDAQSSPGGSGTGASAPAKGPSGGASAPSGPGGGGGSPASGEDSIGEAARSGPGGFARVLLQPAPATKLVLDVMSQRGAEPRDAALERMRRVLADESGKPVDLKGPSALEGDPRSWNEADIRALANEHARVPQGRGTAAIRVLFLRGTYRGSDSVLGVAVRGDVMAIFSDNVRGASSPVVRAAVIEEAVTMHELGHLLGLVGLVVRAERQDPDHKGHSRNEGSVMYWAVESSLIGQILGGDPPRDFDAEDLADLSAIRSGA